MDLGIVDTKPRLPVEQTSEPQVHQRLDFDTDGVALIDNDSPAPVSLMPFAEATASNAAFDVGMLATILISL